MKYLLSLVVTSLTFAQGVVVNPAPITITTEAQTAIHTWMIGQTNGITDRTIVDAIDDTATTATANNGVGLRPKALLIDNEVVLVTARTGNVLTITRGTLGTTAAPHVAGSKITVLKHATMRELVGTLLIGKLREVISIAPPTGAILTQREAKKAAEAAEQAALTAAVK